MLVLLLETASGTGLQYRFEVTSHGNGRATSRPSSQGGRANGRSGGWLVHHLAACRLRKAARQALALALVLSASFSMLALVISFGIYCQAVPA